MSENDVRPSAMAKYMDKHNQRFATMSSQARRVKIEQNHTWRLRLLPVQLGPEKDPFIDIAQHWWNKSPVTCPKHTGQAWGGDPEFPCPVCEISERLSSSSAEEINNIGYKVRCNLRVRAHCLVFEMEDQRGNVDAMPLSEVLNPYEFDMYKTTWERFSKFQKWATSGRRGGVENSEWGILDLESGCDLLATQGAKGITLDRCDPSPIFPLDDPNFDNYIKKIWSHIHNPRIIIPTEKQLLEVAVKIEEFAERGGVGRRRSRDEDDDRGRGRGGRGRFNEDDDDGGGNGFRGRGRSRFGEDNDNDAPAHGSRRGFSRSSDDSTGDPAPTRRRMPEPETEQPESVAPPTRRSSAGTRAPAPEPETEQPEQQEAAISPPTRRSLTPADPQPARRSAPQTEEATVTREDMSEDQNPNPAPPPPARRGTRPAAPPPARRAAEEPQAEQPESGTEEVPAPSTRRSATVPAPGGVDEDEDNVTDERRDAAPPVRQRVTEEAPPAVSATAPPARRIGDTSGIKSRLDKLVSKGR